MYPANSKTLNLRHISQPKVVPWPLTDVSRPFTQMMATRGDRHPLQTRSLPSPPIPIPIPTPLPPSSAPLPAGKQAFPLLLPRWSSPSRRTRRGWTGGETAAQREIWGGIPHRPLDMTSTTSHPIPSHPCMHPFPLPPVPPLPASCPASCTCCGPTQMLAQGHKAPPLDSWQSPDVQVSNCTNPRGQVAYQISINPSLSSPHSLSMFRRSTTIPGSFRRLLSA